MPEDATLLAGTLDLLILKTLTMGVLHGYGIAQNIHRLSKEALRVEEGSLYPALQRMAVKGWVASELKKTPTGREARYYRITTAGPWAAGPGRSVVPALCRGHRACAQSGG